MLRTPLNDCHITPRSNKMGPIYTRRYIVMTMINCKEIMLHTGCTQMYCIDTKL